MNIKSDAARRLRRAQTPAEERAWSILRGRQLGWKFRRQCVLEGFIVDFFCADLRLVIELDGGIHDDPEHRVRDEQRTAILAATGLEIVRLRNEDVTPAALRAVLKRFGTPLPLRERGRG